MKYYVIAGEASGDLHASNLMKAIAERDASPSFRAWGGDLMEEQGATLVKHYKDLAFMGFIEVVMNLRTITRNLSFCKKDIEEYNPDVIIFIDYPGFNMRIAKWAKQNALAQVLNTELGGLNDDKIYYELDKIHQLFDCKKR